MKKILIFLCLIVVVFSLLVTTGEVANAANTPATGTTQPSVTQGTPAPTFTPTGTPPTSTPTTTLMPLPAITLIFPAQTSTATPTLTPKPTLTAETTDPSGTTDLVPLAPRLKVLIGFVIALWVILTAFVIIYIRQLR
jgi:hypothetical protein